MSTHPAKALRAAIEAAARTANVDDLGQIYSPEIETGAQLPYSQIADIQVIGDDTPCAQSSECFVTINAWAFSRDALDDLIDAWRTALRTDLTVTGHTVDVQEFQDVQIGTDPDGSSHARMTFRYETTPA